MVALSKGSQLTVVNNAISPTHDFHHVTGDFGDHISNISVPSPDFCGFVILVLDASLTIFADGNIVFSGNQPSSGRAMMFVYDQDDNKWYVNSGD